MSQTEPQEILVTQFPCHRDDKVMLEYLVPESMSPS